MRPRSTGNCSVVGCEQPAAVKGLCKQHYNREGKKKYNARWRELIRRRNKAYRKEQPAKFSARDRKYREKRREERRLYHMGYTQKHNAKLCEQKRQWREKQKLKKWIGMNAAIELELQTLEANAHDCAKSE